MHSDEVDLRLNQKESPSVVPWPGISTVVTGLKTQAHLQQAWIGSEDSDLSLNGFFWPMG